jgi:hypothetical protein
MGKAQGEFKKGIREGTDTAEAPPPVAPGTQAASPPVAPPGQIPPAQPATEQPPADGGTPSA